MEEKKKVSGYGDRTGGKGIRAFLAHRFRKFVRVCVYVCVCVCVCGLSVLHMMEKIDQKQLIPPKNY